MLRFEIIWGWIEKWILGKIMSDQIMLIGQGNLVSEVISINHRVVVRDFSTNGSIRIWKGI